MDGNNPGGQGRVLHACESGVLHAADEFAGAGEFADALDEVLVAFLVSRDGFA